jgi:dihydrofolate reductase
MKFYLRFRMIGVMDNRNGIGLKGKLPWSFPTELVYFHEKTTKTSTPQKHNALIMGRLTWESIPKNHRPLQNRLNLILTSNNNTLIELAEKYENITIASDFNCALEYCSKMCDIESIYVIGGESVYQQAIKHSALNIIYQTIIHGYFKCDRFFPTIPENRFSRSLKKEIWDYDTISRKQYRISFYKWKLK